MEIDVALGGLGLEVWSYSPEPKPWLLFCGRRCEPSTEDGGTGLSTLASDGVAQSYERAWGCAGK